MSVLAHYFEGDGLQTTLISLVREHSELVRSPRALWVPFDFGRPLGIPGDADFQRRVVLAALGLLDAGEGPVLVDYPEEAPMADEQTGWACPVNLKLPAEADDRGALLIALDNELAKLAPWYDRALDKQGGTTVGSSTIAIEEIPAFITAFLEGKDRLQTKIITLPAKGSAALSFDVRMTNTGTSDWTWSARPKSLSGGSALTPALDRELSDAVVSHFEVSYPMPLLRETHFIRFQEPGQNRDLLKGLNRDLLQGRGEREGEPREASTTSPVPAGRPPLRCAILGGRRERSGRPLSGLGPGEESPGSTGQGGCQRQPVVRPGKVPQRTDRLPLPLSARRGVGRQG